MSFSPRKMTAMKVTGDCLVKERLVEGGEEEDLDYATNVDYKIFVCENNALSTLVD